MAKSSNLHRLVWARAKGRCEYCGLPQDFDDLPFQIDHIIADYHGGKATASNSALACAACNRFKGPNIAGLDSATGRIVRLFNPRRHKWQRHLRWEGPVLVGRTSIDRATVETLSINLGFRVAFRSLLIAEGVFPAPAGGVQ